MGKLDDPALSEGAVPLETRIVKIGKLNFAVGTMWLSWATQTASAAGTRAWLAGQLDVLPSFEALFIAPGAENRVDIGLSSVYQPRLRALAQVVAAHADTFAPQLPSEAFRWGILADTPEGAYLCAASRDGLPLADTLVDPQEIDTARERIGAQFTDIHWVAPLAAGDFQEKVLTHAFAEPVALPRASKVKMRATMAAALAVALAGIFTFIQHYRAEQAHLAALAALAAVKPLPPPPSGVRARSALDACLDAFEHTQGNVPGWKLQAASCDVHDASFIWRRDEHGLATEAPPGTLVMAGLRTATMSIPLRIKRCAVAQKGRVVSEEAKISDWAIRQRESWRAAGGENPLISVEGIIPSWEMPIDACAQTVAVRWVHTGIWRLSLEW
jgi:hypothetical protein